MAEAGAPGQEVDVIVGLLVPTGTPREIIDVLQREVAKAMARVDVKERMQTLGFETVANWPDEFASWIRTELAKWTRVISAANIRIQ
jgi:tripartite-type tricarboxylate transporter receptor subunit TctC